MADGGRYVEGYAPGGYRYGCQQVTLEWLTATEETKEDFNNLAEHRVGSWDLAKGGILV